MYFILNGEYTIGRCIFWIENGELIGFLSKKNVNIAGLAALNHFNLNAYPFVSPKNTHRDEESILI